jgi:hypothetical protein
MYSLMVKDRRTGKGSSEELWLEDHRIQSGEASVLH